MKVPLLDQATELAYDCIRERGLHLHVADNDAWDALAKEQGELILAFALDLVDQKLAEIDTEKLKKEAA